MVARNNPNEICLTRVYEAPVKVVWDAWTDPDQVAQWWGPRGFTLTTHSKDLRPGGHWDYTMHGPDGVDYPNKTLYHEVDECRKLVYDHGSHDDRPPLFRVTVLFSESDGKTTMNMTMTLPTAEEAVNIRQFIRQAGGNATWDRLAEFLNETENHQHSFVINRSFAAPIELLFEMWTDPDHLSKWLPPTGVEMEFLRADIREGGNSFFKMSNHADVTFYGQLAYSEISKPHRIVYVQRFCDEAENAGCHPALPVFPEALQVTVNFAAEDDQTTRVTVTTEPRGSASAEAIRIFLEIRPSMTQGWTGSFDKLETMVSTIAT